MKNKYINFIIAYDISDKKRLSKLAKYIEQISIRIQKSIFFYTEVKKDDLIKTIEEINKIIDKENDDVRLYRIDVKNSIYLKNGINLEKPLIIKDNFNEYLF
jgi:CRISPR-associated protein Cas2